MILRAPPKDTEISAITAALVCVQGANLTVIEVIGLQTQASVMMCSLALRGQTGHHSDDTDTEQISEYGDDYKNEVFDETVSSDAVHDTIVFHEHTHTNHNHAKQQQERWYQQPARSPGTAELTPT